MVFCLFSSTVTPLLKVPPTTTRFFLSTRSQRETSFLFFCFFFDFVVVFFYNLDRSIFYVFHFPALYKGEGKRKEHNESQYIISLPAGLGRRVGSNAFLFFFFEKISRVEGLTGSCWGWTGLSSAKKSFIIIIRKTRSGLVSRRIESEQQEQLGCSSPSSSLAKRSSRSKS